MVKPPFKSVTLFTLGEHESLMNICTNFILLQCSKTEVLTLSNHNFPSISYYVYGIKKTCTISTQYIYLKF